MYKKLLIIFFILALTSCGFKLYGQNQLPPQLNNLYLQTSKPYDSFTLALKRALVASKTNLVDNSKNVITLNIISNKLTHDNPNVTSSSQATIYNFNYSVVFNLLDQKGSAIITPQVVSATRTVTLSPNEVLEASSEVNLVEEEMEREVVMQVLYKLSSNNVKQALSLKESPTTKLK